MPGFNHGALLAILLATTVLRACTCSNISRARDTRISCNRLPLRSSWAAQPADDPRGLGRTGRWNVPRSFTASASCSGDLAPTGRPCFPHRVAPAARPRDTQGARSYTPWSRSPWRSASSPRSSRGSVPDAVRLVGIGRPVQGGVPAVQRCPAARPRRVRRAAAADDGQGAGRESRDRGPAPVDVDHLPQRVGGAARGLRGGLRERDHRPAVRTGVRACGLHVRHLSPRRGGGGGVAGLVELPAGFGPATHADDHRDRLLGGEDGARRGPDPPVRLRVRWRPSP